MKTTRRLRLRRDDRAISPVIGVVMMIGITAVLAGVTAVLVSVYVEDRPEEEKVAAFSKDDRNDRVTLVQADPDMDWSAYSIGSEQDLRFALNQQAGVLAGRVVPAGEYVLVNGTPADFSAADYLDFCVVGPPAKDVDVYLRNDRTNRLYAQFTFADVASCPA